MTYPLPTEDQVARAADAVVRVLNDVRPGFSSRRQKLLAAQLARVVLRTAFLSSSKNPHDAGAVRWCFHCHSQQETDYSGYAMRCQECGFATVARRPVLTS